MEESFNLELLFKDEEGSSKKLTLRNPKTDLAPEVVQGALDAIANAEIFVSEKGDAFHEVVGARYVRREVEDIYFAE